MTALAALALCLAAAPQTPPDSITNLVRSRPAEARERVADLLADAARSPQRADSLLREGRRIAAAYARVWNDSFPSRHVRWFERLGPSQRLVKIAADSVRLAGNLALGAQGTAEAIQLWRAAYDRARAIADTAGMAAALGNIGVGFHREAQLDSAEAYAARARSFAEAVGDRRTSGNALRTLASIALDRGDLSAARVSYQEALAASRAIGDVRGVASDHTNLGLVAAEVFDFAEARRQYGAAIALAEQHHLDDAAATAHLNLANAESVAGEYEFAVRRYHAAIERFETIDDSVSAALTRHNLGLLELRRGAYREARGHFVKAQAAFERVGTTEDRVQVRRDLAATDAAMGDLRAALTHLREADALLADVPDAHGVVADVAIARADLSAQLNAFVEADAQYATAQALYRRARDIAGELHAAEGRAALLIERKLYDRAIEQLDGISNAQRDAGDARSAALTRLTIAHAQRERRDFGAARRSAERALTALDTLGDIVGRAAALTVLGDVENEAGAPLTAARHYREGLALLRDRPLATLGWELHAGLARALRRSGNVDAAVREFRMAAGDLEAVAGTLALPERRSTFLSDKWSVYADLALTLRANGDAVGAFEASERLRARQMLDVLSHGRVETGIPRDNSIYARQQDLRARIRELTRQLEADVGASELRGPDLSPVGEAATREALARAQEQYAQLLLELRGIEHGMAAIVRGETVSWRAAADRLAPGRAMLTYLMTDTASVVFVLTRDTLRAVDLDIGRAALASLIDFTRGTLMRPQSSSASWRVPLRRLYQHLIAPVEATGILAGIRQLTIVPHGELHYLPFAALIREGDGREEFLVERFDVGYAPSASVFTRLGARASPASRRVLALAPRPSQLPGARDEVEAIRRTYGEEATVLIGPDASEQAFRSAAGTYGIVHLATYGVLNQHNPLFSFVELNASGDDDGRLEVHEVFGLSLNARLLVLSACQTGLASGAVSDVPAGDDWVGLVRAFLSAGAANVIATLWAVEDRATAGLMERLHVRLRAGDSEATALSEAQRQTLRNSATSSPFYWAGFALVGGP